MTEQRGGCVGASTPFHLILRHQRGGKRSDARRVSAGIATPISSLRNAADGRLSPRPTGAPQARQCGVTALVNRVSYFLRAVPCLDVLWGALISQDQVKRGTSVAAQK